jgi:Fic family protein
MEKIIQQIELLRAELAGLMPMQPALAAKLEKKMRMEFNFNSNHLEGNTLTYNETELLLIFDETKGNHTLREYEEMKAHDVALQLVKEWAIDPERPLTENNIKNLNEIILVKPFWKDAITKDGQPARRLIKIGDYKEFPNSVRLNNGEIFEYASVADTPIFMGELMEWYRNAVEDQTLHTVALAALMHYKFVCIHPFDDGNGRISRLLMNYVFLKHGFPPVIIKSADKRKYLSALNSADSGDVNAFIQYIAQQLVWSLELSIKAAKGEPIEEAGDMEKEIALWKKQAVLTEVEAQHRNNKLVYELYNNGIRELFEEFEGKMQQFYDLFRKAECHTFKNSGGGQGVAWLNGDMQATIFTRRLLINADGANESLSQIEDTFDNIFIRINLVEYKYSEQNPFSASYELYFEFLPYKYVLRYTNKLLIEKKYGEFINAEERQAIISDSVKAVFAEIKAKSGNGVH